MTAFQERVVEEKEVLNSKLEKLNQFFTTAIYEGLGKEEQDRLRQQAYYMTEYSRVLKERIEAF